MALMWVRRWEERAAVGKGKEQKERASSRRQFLSAVEETEREVRRIGATADAMVNIKRNVSAGLDHSRSNQVVRCLVVVDFGLRSYSCFEKGMNVTKTLACACVV